MSAIQDPINTFISYAQRDKRFFDNIEANLSTLKRQGFSIWHPGMISAGTDLQAEREAKLLASQLILVLLSPDYTASDICMDTDTALAFQLYQKEKAKIVPIRLREVDVTGTPYEHVQIIPRSNEAIIGRKKRNSTKDSIFIDINSDIRQAADEVRQHINATSEIKLEVSVVNQPDVDICPYLGLQSYTEADAEFFFGRQQYIDELISLLREDRRLLAVLGPTGSGKTSVVQAGLFPLLREDKLSSSSTWEIISIQPSSDPFAACITSGICDANKNLAIGVRNWIQEHPNNQRLVFYIDQFEELFTLTPESIRRAFLDQLIELIKDDKTTVIFTMNDAYYSDLAQYTRFIKLIERYISNIPVIRRDDIKTIIEKPAEIAQLHFEEGLVRKITDDTLRSVEEPKEKREQRHSSFLSILSFCLKQLYDRSQNRTIRYEDLDSIGGVAGAIIAWATTTYNELNPHQQSLAKRLFMELVEVSDDSNQRLDYRLQKTLTELTHSSENAQDIRTVVEIFVQAHVLEATFDDNTKDIHVNIIHEILLREWSLLQGWLREDQRFHLWHQEIAKKTQQWTTHHVSHRRDFGYLLRGQSLLEAEGWLQERKKDLNFSEQEFIEVSIQHREQEKQKEKENEDIKRKQNIALAKQIAMKALLIQENEHQHIKQSLLLAVESMLRYPNEEADQALRRGLQLLPSLIARFQFPKASSMQFSASGNSLAVMGANDIGWMQHITFYNEEVQRFHLRNACFIAFSMNERFLFVGCKDGLMRLTDTASKNIVAFAKYSKRSSSIIEGQEDTFIAIERKDKSIEKWTLPRLVDDQLPTAYEITKKSLANIPDISEQNLVTAIAASSDEQTIAIAYNNGDIRIWRRESGWEQTRQLYQSAIHIMVFSPNDAILAVTGDENTVALWDWQNQQDESIHSETGITRLSHPERVAKLAFSSDSNFLVTLDAKATATIWTIDDEIVSYSIPHEHISTIETHKKLNLLATLSKEDGVVKIWSIDAKELLYCINHDNQVETVALNPSEPYIATAENGYVNVWKMNAFHDHSETPYQGHVLHLVFSQHERKHYLYAAVQKGNSLEVLLITASNGYAVKDHEFTQISGFAFTRDGKRLRSPTAHINRSIFSLDGRHIAIAQSDRTVHIINAIDQQLVASFSRLVETTELAFSHDGHYLAIACKDNTIFLWDWNDAEQDNIKCIRHQESVITMSFSREAEYLITADDGGNVYIWKWRTEQERSVHALKHEGDIRTLELSPDGRYLLTASTDRKARVWVLNTGSLIHLLLHKDAVMSAIFSKDGQYIATVSNDCTAVIWETSTGNSLARLHHRGRVHKVAFSDDNAYLATASDDSKIYVWRWGTESLIADAKTRLTGNLTYEEWYEYFGHEPYHRTFTDLGWREIPQAE